MKKQTKDKMIHSEVTQLSQTYNPELFVYTNTFNNIIGNSISRLIITPKALIILQKTLWQNWFIISEFKENSQIYRILSISCRRIREFMYLESLECMGAGSCNFQEWRMYWKMEKYATICFIAMQGGFYLNAMFIIVELTSFKFYLKYSCLKIELPTSSPQIPNCSASISLRLLISLFYFQSLFQIPSRYLQNDLQMLYYCISLLYIVTIINNYSMLIKILLLVGILTVGIVYQVGGDGRGDEFLEFKERQGKAYGVLEEQFRRYIYNGNKRMIETHNEKEQRNYVMEINRFADLTLLEFKEMYLGLVVTSGNSLIMDNKKTPQVMVQFQVQIDWQLEGKITRVKNQQMCASCWAFSVVGAIESAYMIRGINQLFSQQQLVDCSTSYGNNGCKGGQLIYTYDYILKKGITTEQMYPYMAKDQNCKKTKGQFHIKGYVNSITCSGLYTSLIRGPVSVAVDANYWGFYKDGIFDDCGNEVNHGVLLIGVTADYWRIKNSWGAQWGNNGFMKLKRGNTCSICQYQFHPTL